MLRPLTDEAIELTKSFEGLHLKPYHCPAGLVTIGYGHVLSFKPGEPLDKWGPITEDEAETMLMQDLAKAAVPVLRLVKVPLSDGMYGALVDFVFNLGWRPFSASTLLRKVNAGEHQEAGEQFLRWVYANGRALKGLLRRRQAERALYVR